MVFETGVKRLMTGSTELNECNCDNPDFFEGAHERKTCGNCGELV